MFCGECGTKQEVSYYDYFNNNSQSEQEAEPQIKKTKTEKAVLKSKVDELCGGSLANKTFELKLLKNGLPKTDANVNYKYVLNKEIDTGKLVYIEDVELRLDELLKMDVNALRNKIIMKGMDSSQFKTQQDIENVLGNKYSKKWSKKQNKTDYATKESKMKEYNSLKNSNNLGANQLKEKINAITGRNFSDSDYFKARKQKFNAKENFVYYREILKLEAKTNNLKYEDVEDRLDELLQINDAETIFELRVRRPTHLFKTRQDLDQFIGYGTKKNPIPLTDEEMEKINEKLENSGSNHSSSLQNILAEESHKKTVEIIRETKKVPISIPNGRKLFNSPLTGALTGDMIAGGAGRMIGGLAGAGDVLGSAMGAMSGGLILGGAGALIGGLLAAKDDGIEWFDTVLVLDEEGATIAGKLVLPYKDIKHVNAEKGSKFDVVTLTMRNTGLQFKTPNGIALKEVMDEMMEGIEFDNGEPKQIPISSPTSETDKVDALMKYAELYEKGLLTQEEFEAKKKELL